MGLIVFDWPQNVVDSFTDRVHLSKEYDLTSLNNSDSFVKYILNTIKDDLDIKKLLL